MTTTKTPTQYDPNGTITPFQIKRIRQLCNFSEDEKNKILMEFTQGATSSLKNLTQNQAVALIKQLSGNESVNEPPVENWAVFNKKSRQHIYILSLLLQLNWKVSCDKYGSKADLVRLSNWLKSDKSPVKKPLQKMNPEETSKIIYALESMVTKSY
ncbi:hypothetical protein [Flavobacterium covae]|uniref:hypothetical protein n=1 Tax=Flavobacterium covae TaxID=2906076 RepID=UPI000745F005|nr:hypothetical protein [Flavobacterium covae]AMA49431.1 hypothetical protein AWN65_08160 [Flavobacterium covae]MCJ1808962.1 hypothetical protein [Flavobacterium covae]